MTDKDLMDIFKKHLAECYDGTQILKPFDSTMLSAMREAVEKGSIGFVKFIAKEIDDERNDSPFDKSNNGDIRVYYYKGDKLGCYNPTLEEFYKEYIKSLK